MKKLTLDDLNAAHEKLMQLEPRGGFYDFARIFTGRESITDNIAGALILTATWNSGRFRFANKSTILDELGRALIYSRPILEKLENERIETADINNIRKDIREIYSRLSEIIGVEYTGASKILSLNNTNLFVMWDDYIRKEYGFGKSADEYVRFLGECQQASKDIKLQDSISIAKAIDEYNYMNISYPAVQKEKQKEKEMQKKAKEEKLKRRQNETKT